MEKKKCSTCNELLDLDNFAKQKSAKSGYKSACKKCNNYRDYERRQKLKSLEKINIPEEKKCIKCGEMKSIFEFNVRADSLDGRTNQCKICRNEIIRIHRKKTQLGKKQYQKNKEKNKQKCAKYYQNHKEEIKARTNKYYYENKDQVMETAKKYRKKKMKDPNYRIVRNLRNRVWYAIKNNTKYAPTLELIGCSIPHLKSHLEAQFKEGMTWENYGEWHIDHIKPCAGYDLSIESQQKECFHYTNLQPLWAIENIKKGTT